jgi:hypothetical protein
MNDIQNVSTKILKTHPDNPRLIKDHKYKKLVQSIADFPDMLTARPLIVNKDNIVLGGNMRLRACQELGFKEVPVMYVDWTEEQEKQFVIKDNVSFGEWNWDDLANDWNSEDLNEWGLEVWQTPDYEPELNPDTSYREVTDDQIAKTSDNLTIDDQEMKLITITCPHCNEVYKIAKP